MGFGASRLDVRLVPAALVSWIVTAAGIVWPIGNVCALCCVVVALGGGALWWCVARRSWHAPRLGSISAGLVAVGMVGAGYGLAVALRSEAVDRHPITVAFGTSALVTVTPSESPVSLGRGRLMFRATVQRLRDDETSGRVVVFARALDFGELMVGQPVQFRARISRPARHDLRSRCSMRPVGRPWAVPARYTAPLTSSAIDSRPRFVRCCPLTRPRCCRPWFSAIPRRSPP